MRGTASQISEAMKPAVSARWRFSRGVLAFAPFITIVLIAALIGVLLWYIDKAEREQRRLDLIKDALWVEQTLRFQVVSLAERLGELAGDIGNRRIEPPTFDRRAELQLRADPELANIIWRDTTGAPLRVMPPALGVPDPANIPALADALRQAQISGRRVFSQVHDSADGAILTLVTPIYTAGVFDGSVTAQMSLKALLVHHVPWWVAEKYQLILTDETENRLATRSQVDIADSGLSHSIAFDMPDRPMRLVLAPLAMRTGLIENTLVAVIIALALLAMGSLLAVHLHLRRRLDAEATARAETAFRRAMEDSLTVGMRARDLEGRVIYANNAFCRMVGFSRENLLGAAPPMPYWVPEDYEHTYEIHKAVIEGRAPPEGFEIRFQRAGGERFDALVYEAPLVDADGTHIGWMASILDITERKQAEDMMRQQSEKLQRTSRLVTMGEMASTLAHELNQPLSAIASYAAGCLNRIAAGTITQDELAVTLEKLRVQAQRAGHVIRRVHDFVRSREPHFATADIDELVADVTGFLAADARKHGAQMVASIAPDLPPILADRILIEQVLLNLVRNAFEAMAATPKPVRIVEISAAEEADDIFIRVADRGAGISPEIADRLFTPFATTKPDGMGMGLNICRSIIELHKGRLSCAANPHGGTTFTVVLPRGTSVHDKAAE